MTTKALIYRSGSKWPIVAAFTAAAAIHLSAVAIASIHHQPVVIPDPGFTEVDVEPPSPEPVSAPEPQEIRLPQPPDPVLPADFVDPLPPPRSVPKRSLQPIHVVSATSTIRSGMGKPVAVRAPRPVYPYEARFRHITGSGVVLLTVDPATGLVRDATMVQSTGNPILDNSAVSAFRRWVFKSGTAPNVKIPITFTMTGASY